MKILIRSMTSLTVLVILISTSIYAAPFGESADIKYPQKLWEAMGKANFVFTNQSFSIHHIPQLIGETNVFYCPHFNHVGIQAACADQQQK
ncbi:MAG: hypothetical protein CMQ21_08595 [Gammaproteobacteria bacterium]|nr:hypothetical protein [Gammaproteobacteria bacterium]|tara:strand:- start:9520 stop:9792 length:273 start_codon:yes stop_codon:yes gene_type:complete